MADAENELTMEAFLRLIVGAKAAIDPKEEAFRVVGVERRHGPQVRHRGLSSPDVAARAYIDVPRQRIEDLADAGLIRLRKQTQRTPRVIVPGQPSRPSTTHQQWEFDVLPAAVAEVRRLDALAGPPPSEPVNVSWEQIEPVLVAVFEAYPKSLPGVGVSREQVNEALGRGDDDRQTSRALYELVRAEYLKSTHQSDSHLGPSYVELTEKGLRRVAGWPTEGAERTANMLIDLLQQRVDSATDEVERSKWERLRDGALGVGHDVLVELLSTLAQSGARHIPT